jgi:L-arabinokinase
MSTIAYYITAHGYGHGTRSCDILNALHRMAPEVQLIVRTDLPNAFLRSRLPEPIRIMPGAFDVGLIQKDSIQVDLEASLKALDELYVGESRLIAEEVRFIKREKAGVLVADIPAIPLAAAREAGIPAVATGNFGWDWIYEDFVRHDRRWQRYADRFREAYRNTDLLLRQPFAEPMAAFPRRIDLPLLAKPGNARREMIAQATGADSDRQWVLLSFTSLELEAPALDNFSHLRRCEIFSVEPLEWPGSAVHCLKRSTAGFADMLASMDLVVTKPGFGIVSDCIANDKPIIYADREHFREYDILVENIRKYCRYAFIPSRDLYAGRLEQALKEAAAAPPPPDTMAQGGAEIAAEAILNILHGRT